VQDNSTSWISRSPIFVNSRSWRRDCSFPNGLADEPVPLFPGMSALMAAVRRATGLPRFHFRVGLHIDLFEVCSASTRVAACTLAQSPNAAPRHRGATIGLYSCVGFGGGSLGTLLFGVTLDQFGGTSQLVAWALSFGPVDLLVWPVLPPRFSCPETSGNGS